MSEAIENETFIKKTVGTVVQTFDKNGNLISQEFESSDDVDGNIEALEFYAPFEMIQPNFQDVDFNIYDGEGGDDLIGIIASKSLQIPEVEGEIIENTVRRAIEAAQREYKGEFAFTVEDVKHRKYDDEGILEIAFLEK